MWPLGPRAANTHTHTHTHKKQRLLENYHVIDKRLLGLLLGLLFVLTAGTGLISCLIFVFCWYFLFLALLVFFCLGPVVRRDRLYRVISSPRREPAKKIGQLAHFLLRFREGWRDERRSNREEKVSSRKNKTKQKQMRTRWDRLEGGGRRFIIVSYWLLWARA